MHQRRGIGSMIIAVVQAHLTALGHRTLLTSWHTGPGSPEPFYFRHGFAPTGRMVDDEVEARLSW
jgi:diamine N-acetyltransferase